MWWLSDGTYGEQGLVAETEKCAPRVGEILLVLKSSTMMVSLSEEVMENSYTGLRTDRQ